MEAKALEARDWILQEWSEKLCLVLESMVDQRPAVQPFGQAVEAISDPDALIWSQIFAVMAKPAVWVATSAATVVDLGRRTLAAAGVEEPEAPECRSTFLEVLSQSLSALGISIGSNWDVKAQAGAGEETTQVPKDLEWVPVILDFKGTQLEPIWFATAVALLDQLTSSPEEVELPAAGLVTPLPQSVNADPAIAAGSKTFELLLDVSLPVSISFGRTMMPIKEVLRLANGSIVELDHVINEPVDVIVNNCVIARGEVVVIEGNYGVRIQEIASRFDRLRTGTSATQAQHALPGS